MSPTLPVVINIPAVNLEGAIQMNAMIPYKVSEIKANRITMAKNITQ